MQCLGGCISETDSSYIYLSCHTALTTTNIEKPVVLYHIKEGKVKDGANVLKALNENWNMCVYVCICCHQLLFHKTVRNFLIDEYDNTNEVVQKCLSHQYKSKQNAIQYVMVYLDEHQMKHLIIMDVPLTLDITTWRMNSFAYVVETA